MYPFHLYHQLLYRECNIKGKGNVLNYNKIDYNKIDYNKNKKIDKEKQIDKEKYNIKIILKSAIFSISNIFNIELYNIILLSISYDYNYLIGYNKNYILKFFKFKNLLPLYKEYEISIFNTYNSSNDHENHLSIQMYQSKNYIIMHGYDNKIIDTRLHYITILINRDLENLDYITFDIKFTSYKPYFTLDDHILYEENGLWHLFINNFADVLYVSFSLNRLKSEEVDQICDCPFPFSTATWFSNRIINSNASMYRIAIEPLNTYSFNIELFLQNFLLKKVLKPNQSLISFELSNIKPTTTNEINCTFALLLSVHSDLKIQYDCLLVGLLINFITLKQSHSIYRFVNFHKLIDSTWSKDKIINEFCKLFHTNSFTKPYSYDILKCNNFNVFNHVPLEILKNRDDMLSFRM